jgi:hypothetical protein
MGKKDQGSDPKPSRKWVKTFKEMGQNLQGNESKRPRKGTPSEIGPIRLTGDQFWKDPHWRKFIRMKNG